ncbi:diphosphomevalonate decarboxylase [Herpetosiphon sp. NSE202]|uniref:diphosphomevalonate decarboxylase n=1 Tax=Herpetosiphon sp. NSE202 TaxID=3351349 RepID=UPI0036459F82
MKQLSHAATAVACANIAFIKYWGQRDAHLTLPTNGSISMNLDGCLTETTVQCLPEAVEDSVWLALSGGEEVQAKGRQFERVIQQIERLRQLAGVSERVEVRSRNNFPSDAGIASSAAAFAALTRAAAAAFRLELDEAELSRLTRLSGSGSACRSIPAGFVEWFDDGTHAGSYAAQIAPPEHWNLVDIVAVISTEAKHVASTSGHSVATTSPYFPVRLEGIEQRLADVRQGILERDIQRLGQASEADAMSMHVIAMTAHPATMYWLPGTLAVMQAVQRWRVQDNLQSYWTIDAGPNVHVICEAKDAPEVEARLCELDAVQWTIVNGAGPEARLVG